MTAEQRKVYKKLSRQIGEAYDKLFDNSPIGGQIRGKSPANYNFRLRAMKDFLSTLPTHHSNNAYINMEFIDERPVYEGCGALCD